MLTPFPTEFPSEALMMVLDAFRGNVPTTHEIALGAWNVAGYAADRFIPLPNNVLPVSTPMLVTPAEIEAAFNSALAHGNPPAGSVQTALSVAIPWDIIFAVALEIFRRFQARRA